MEDGQSDSSPLNERWARETPYQQWQQGEGVPKYPGSYIADLYSLELAYWPRLGQQAAFVNLAAQEHDDGWVVEIAPRGQTEAIHHAFESTSFVLSGRGATTFWQPNTRKQTVEWQRGSLFSPPLNCYYQHFNLDGDRPARLFAVSACPMIMNFVRDPGFVFDNPYVFADRYNGEDDYFTDAGRMDGRFWRTNFIPDIRAFKLRDNEGGRRGVGVRGMMFNLANNSMQCHVSQWPSGTYKKAHCHGVGAHVTILGGQGYTLLWSEGEPRIRVDWKDGTVLSPRDGEYHQHFGTGPTPASFLALRLGALDLSRGSRSLRYNPKYRNDSEDYDGGIPYEDEDPAIYDEFAEDCRKNGVEVVLPRPARR